jgi:ABC-type transporter Mla subunit MlaD
VTRRRSNASIVANPVLVGAVTVLVTTIAVFLSYNANSGLPFVPTTDIRVQLHDAGGIQSGREVRVGGKRVGIVKDVHAVVRGGRPFAEAELKLEQRFGSVRSDSRVTVRPISPLGLKYVELEPGRRGRTLAQDATLPLRQANRSVELASTLGSFEAGTRKVGKGARGATAELSRRGTGLVGLGTALAGPVAALAGVAPASAELGTGLAGRGPALNRGIEQAPPLLGNARAVASNLADPRTGLRRFLRGADLTVSELAAARAELGGVMVEGEVTSAAVAREAGSLRDLISEAPPTESAGTRALAAARPVLDDAATFLREARPGLRMLRPASRDLHLALRDGIPVLRRSISLSGRLRVALRAVATLSRDPETRVTLTKLRDTLRSLQPTLEFGVPAQTRCNYLALFTRNAASAVSEGDPSGTWLRFIATFPPDENTPQERPAPGLHANPYANTAAPGQGGECEAGREPFLPGQRIGNVPGFQGGSTEGTSPQSIVPEAQP